MTSRLAREDLVSWIEGNPTPWSRALADSLSTLDSQFPEQVALFDKLMREQEFVKFFVVLAAMSTGEVLRLAFGEG